MKPALLAIVGFLIVSLLGCVDSAPRQEAQIGTSSVGTSLVLLGFGVISDVMLASPWIYVSQDQRSDLREVTFFAHDELLRAESHKPAQTAAVLKVSQNGDEIHFDTFEPAESTHDEVNYSQRRQALLVAVAFMEYTGFCPANFWIRCQTHPDRSQEVSVYYDPQYTPGDHFSVSIQNGVAKYYGGR